MNAATMESYSADPPGNGRFITAHGTLKVLVVFAQFPDDHRSVSDWTDRRAATGYDGHVYRFNHYGAIFEQI